MEGCILIQPYFVTGYSTYLRIPLWTANRMNGTVHFIPISGEAKPTIKSCYANFKSLSLFFISYEIERCLGNKDGNICIA